MLPVQTNSKNTRTGLRKYKSIVLYVPLTVIAFISVCNGVHIRLRDRAAVERNTIHWKRQGENQDYSFVSFEVKNGNGWGLYHRLLIDGNHAKEEKQFTMRGEQYQSRTTVLTDDDKAAIVKILNAAQFPNFSGVMRPAVVNPDGETSRTVKLTIRTKDGTAMTINSLALNQAAPPSYYSAIDAIEKLVYRRFPPFPPVAARRSTFRFGKPGIATQK